MDEKLDERLYKHELTNQVKSGERSLKDELMSLERRRLILKVQLDNGIIPTKLSPKLESEDGSLHSRVLERSLKDEFMSLERRQLILKVQLNFYIVPTELSPKLAHPRMDHCTHESWRGL
ncbi:hypothetical protein Fmac_005723 [Flemingia macrophylla]|uniref:Uncharacterized protein n=1 Tax=Flemingia macrophylla TaxID=520843 RepID=A0ABD1N8Y6_9FABA